MTDHNGKPLLVLQENDREAQREAIADGVQFALLVDGLVRAVCGLSDSGVLVAEECQLLDEMMTQPALSSGEIDTDDIKLFAPASAESMEAQRRSFAFGNTHLSNSRITREMIDHAAEQIARPETKTS